MTLIVTSCFLGLVSRCTDGLFSIHGFKVNLKKSETSFFYCERGCRAFFPIRTITCEISVHKTKEKKKSCTKMLKSEKNVIVHILHGNKKKAANPQMSNSLLFIVI